MIHFYAARRDQYRPTKHKPSVVEALVGAMRGHEELQFVDSYLEAQVTESPHDQWL